MIENMVKQTLKEYNFELTDNGIQAIVFQVLLLHGKNAKLKQVKEVVEQNKISYINEQKKVYENGL